MEESHSESISARRRLGPVLLVVSAIVGGLIYLRTRTSEPPHEPRPSVELALTLLKDHEVERAEQVLTAVLQAEQDSVNAAEELRWLYFYQFRERDVERVLGEQLARFPERHDTLYHLMMTEFQVLTPREGMGRLLEIEAAHPGQLPVVRALAYCYWHLGELERARDEFERALTVAPEDPETLLMLAEFSLEQNQLPSAESCLSRDNLPADDRPHWLRSLLAERQGDLQLALREVERAHELRPFELKYVYQKGSLLQRLGKTADAEQAFDLAKQIETVEREMNEIVLSEAITQIDLKLSRRLADLSRTRGRLDHAQAWSRLADRIEQGEPR